MAPLSSGQKNMDRKNQHTNNWAKRIEKDFIDARTIISELDNYFHSLANKNGQENAYLPLAYQLIELSKSYQEIQNLLDLNNKQSVQETIN